MAGTEGGRPSCGGCFVAICVANCVANCVAINCVVANCKYMAANCVANCMAANYPASHYLANCAANCVAASCVWIARHTPTLHARDRDGLSQPCGAFDQSRLNRRGCGVTSPQGRGAAH